MFIQLVVPFSQIQRTMKNFDMNSHNKKSLNVCSGTKIFSKCNNISKVQQANNIPVHTNEFSEIYHNKARSSLAKIAADLLKTPSVVLISPDLAPLSFPQ